MGNDKNDSALKEKKLRNFLKMLTSATFPEAVGSLSYNMYQKLEN